MQSQVGPDSVVAGRYTLERCINTGGIGSLWRARDEQTGRPCALRLADGTGHNIFELAARYRAEVDIIERIRCENVLDIFDYGDWNDMPYLVVEHVEGEDLATRLRREGHLPPELAYRILAQTARALARAHVAGIVHGDVTPENILIAADGMQSVAKIYNFSLTQRTTEISVGTVTKIGSFLRLPYYASPEQAAGKTLDWRSDLWSLGVLAYECLSGRKPFESNVFGDLVGQILFEPIPALVLPSANTPPKLRDWWQKACARDPAKRFQSAKEMSDALGQTFDFPIVFVPDAAGSGMGGSTSSSSVPVVLPGSNEEPRVGVRRKSVPKMARQTTQIGLGVANQKIPLSAPIPAPVSESAPAIDRAPNEAKSPVVESADLPEDMFEGFQTSEAPTLAFRQAEALPLPEEDVLIDIVDSQRMRTKSLRRTVTWVVAALLALVSAPLVWKFVVAKHKKPTAPVAALVMPSAAGNLQIGAISTNASAGSKAESGSSSINSAAAAPAEEQRKPDSLPVDAGIPGSVSPDLVASIALANSETKRAAKSSPVTTDSPRKKPAVVSPGKPHSVPAAAKPKPTPATNTPAAAPKPAKTNTRDYGI